MHHKQTVIEVICGAIALPYGTYCAVSLESLPIILQAVSIFAVGASGIYYVVKIRKSLKK